MKFCGGGGLHNKSYIQIVLHTFAGGGGGGQQILKWEYSISCMSVSLLVGLFHTEIRQI